MFILINNLQHWFKHTISLDFNESFVWVYYIVYVKERCILLLIFWIKLIYLANQACIESYFINV